MADIDDRNARLVPQTREIGQDLRLAIVVESRKRLVHQKQARRREKRAPDRDALALASGQVGRRSAEQGRNAEKVDDPVEIAMVRTARREPAAEGQVSPHAEMREEPGLLEHIAEPPAVRGDETAQAGVEQDVVIEHDPAGLWPREARDYPHERRLA